MAETVKLWKDPDGAYFRIRDKSMFPSLADTDVIFMYGDYLEVKGSGPLTFIPPSMYGPPEFVHVDWKDTESPGLVIKEYGKGNGGMAAVGPRDRSTTGTAPKRTPASCATSSTGCCPEAGS